MHKYLIMLHENEEKPPHHTHLLAYMKCAVLLFRSAMIANMNRPSHKSSAAWEYRNRNACTQYACHIHTRHMYGSRKKYNTIKHDIFYYRRSR